MFFVCKMLTARWFVSSEKSSLATKNSWHMTGWTICLSTSHLFSSWIHEITRTMASYGNLNWMDIGLNQAAEQGKNVLLYTMTSLKYNLLILPHWKIYNLWICKHCCFQNLNCWTQHVSYLIEQSILNVYALEASSFHIVLNMYSESWLAPKL